jgi:hypothetical protein
MISDFSQTLCAGWGDLGIFLRIHRQTWIIGRWREGPATWYQNNCKVVPPNDS